VKYRVQVGGRTVEVAVDGAAVIVAGRAVEARLAGVDGTPLRHLLLDGASCEIVAVGSGEPGWWRLSLGDQRLDATVTDERTASLRAVLGRGVPQGAGGLVTAPMPGLVVRVKVAEGQRVEAGAGLIVVEAMKMENELRAAAAGVVRRIHVSAGDAVEKGARLLEIEPAAVDAS
jgi:pyruvate carboxylase subunit B